MEIIYIFTVGQSVITGRISAELDASRRRINSELAVSVKRSVAPNEKKIPNCK